VRSIRAGEAFFTGDRYETAAGANHAGVGGTLLVANDGAERTAIGVAGRRCADSHVLNELRSLL
jgi:hypothetical protein